MRHLGGVVVGLGLLALPGCAHEEADFPSQEELYGEQYNPNDFLLLGSGGQVVNATVGEEGVIGPEVNLGRYTEDDGQALRGVMFRRPVSLKISRAEAEGLWGTEPVRVRVTRQEKKLRVEGLVRGRMTDVWIGPQQLSGSIGSCGYDVERRGRVYEGSYSCGGRVQQVTVQVPETFGRWGDAGFGAALVMLLSP
ncbi:hypothetical protein [Polyangium aurulentum]|uniref:hypothetical protein n=1 Tax=Polyangium aurulentum TaxID=2567896 RepID=UPI0010AE341A|nr:hypothetical protein [Polyangium aurulentum]UQA58392.1 hypothetical protein E8A73_045305 [Polyangium aurulentum]